MYFIFAAIALTLLAPQGSDPPGLTAISAAYHKERLKETKPPYELTKVQKLVNDLEKHQPDTEVGTLAISAEQFGALSTEAKFTYCMIHGDTYSQNCDGMPDVLGEETKIFAQPATAFSGYQDWSARQTTFLHDNRKEVLRLIRRSIGTDHRVGVNLKKAIVELNAVELIPDLESIFDKSRRDLDILSVLSLLMKHSLYTPYTSTEVCKRLYLSPDADYQTSVPATPATETLILKSAMALSKAHKA